LRSRRVGQAFYPPGFVGWHSPPIPLPAATMSFTRALIPTIGKALKNPEMNIFVYGAV
jgi:hypothetical protein